MYKQKLEIYVDTSSRISYSSSRRSVNEEINQIKNLLGLPERFKWINFSKTVEFHNCIIMLDYEPVYLDFYNGENITEKVLWCIENNTFLF